MKYGYLLLLAAINIFGLAANVYFIVERHSTANEYAAVLSLSAAMYCVWVHGYCVRTEQVLRMLRGA